MQTEIKGKNYNLALKAMAEKVNILVRKKRERLTPAHGDDDGGSMLR